MAARWSATTLAIGMREVQFTLLTTDRHNLLSRRGKHICGPWLCGMPTIVYRLQPVVSWISPWAIVWKSWLVKLMKNPEPAVPGQPVLPDLTLVAAGEKTLTISPSPSCPWPTGVFQTAAESTISGCSQSQCLRGF